MNPLGWIKEMFDLKKRIGQAKAVESRLFGELRNDIDAGKVSHEHLELALDAVTENVLKQGTKSLKGKKP